MDIRRTYNYISKNKLPNRKNMFKRLFCEHDLVDNILTSENGLQRISGEDHIVYCEKCGYIKGCYSREY